MPAAAAAAAASALWRRKTIQLTHKICKQFGWGTVFSTTTPIPASSSSLLFNTNILKNNNNNNMDNTTTNDDYGTTGSHRCEVDPTHTHTNDIIVGGTESIFVDDTVRLQYPYVTPYYQQQQHPAKFYQSIYAHYPNGTNRKIRHNHHHNNTANVNNNNTTNINNNNNNNNNNNTTTTTSKHADTDSMVVRWVCTVWVGINDQRHFMTNKYYPCTWDGQRHGMRDVSTIAIHGLQNDITNELVKPMKDISEVFYFCNNNNNNTNNNTNNTNNTSTNATNTKKTNDTNTIQIYESTNTNWDTYFWNNDKNNNHNNNNSNSNNNRTTPRIVGIDTEGNKLTPPALIQIATDEYTILEYPKDGCISTNLQKLLLDDTIIKVFCDSNTHRDKKSLGIQVPVVASSSSPENNNNNNNNDNDKGNAGGGGGTNTTSNNNNITSTSSAMDFINGPIVDIEVIATQLLGPTQFERGICKLISLSMPELNGVVTKKKKQLDDHQSTTTTITTTANATSDTTPSLQHLQQLQQQEQSTMMSTTRRYNNNNSNVWRFIQIEDGIVPPLQSLYDLSQEEQQYAALDAWCTLQVYHRFKPYLQ